MPLSPPGMSSENPRHDCSQGSRRHYCFASGTYIEQVRRLGVLAKPHPSFHSPSAAFRTLQVQAASLDSGTFLQGINDKQVVGRQPQGPCGVCTLRHVPSWWFCGIFPLTESVLFFFSGSPFGVIDAAEKRRNGRLLMQDLHDSRCSLSFDECSGDRTRVREGGEALLDGLSWRPADHVGRATWLRTKILGDNESNPT